MALQRQRLSHRFRQEPRDDHPQNIDAAEYHGRARGAAETLDYDSSSHREYSADESRTIENKTSRRGTDRRGKKLSNRYGHPRVDATLRKESTHPRNRMRYFWALDGLN